MTLNLPTIKLKYKKELNCIDLIIYFKGTLTFKVIINLSLVKLNLIRINELIGYEHYKSLINFNNYN